MKNILEKNFEMITTNLKSWTSKESDNFRKAIFADFERQGILLFHK